MIHISSQRLTNSVNMACLFASAENQSNGGRKDCGCEPKTSLRPVMLIASRPIAIRTREQTVPDGFTVITAAAGDQTAKPLEEARHGMFSYFLMKGMEGDADANKDDKITAGELHAYVQRNVIQQSSGSQTPEIQGDADRVLVRFQ